MILTSITSATKDEVALVNEQATLDPMRRTYLMPFSKTLRNLCFTILPLLAAMTPPVDVAPDGLSVPIISQDDDDDSTVEPMEDDAIEVIYDQTERLQQADGSLCDIEAIVDHHLNSQN
jgi:hypothetical protein